MLKHLFIVLAVILMLKSSSYALADEFDEEDIDSEGPEVVDSFSRTYEVAPYPWQLWNFPSYQIRPRIPQDVEENEGPAPYADPRFVTNHCQHSGHSYTTTTSNTCTTTTTTFTITVTETTTVSASSSTVAIRLTEPTSDEPMTTSAPATSPAAV